MYKLHTSPADTTSPIFKLSIPFFNKGTPKEWIKFWCGLQAVLKGQNIMQHSCQDTTEGRQINGLQTGRKHTR
eukprot:139974-Ditylum_brightwellii.AAC.1